MIRPLMLTPLLLFCLLPGGCSQEGESNVINDHGMLKGIAKVVSVHDDLGMVTLEIDGKQVQGYWQVERTQAQGGAKVESDPLKPPVGDYREPLVQHRGFPARPGDTIVFVGMRTGSSLFLVQAVPQ